MGTVYLAEQREPIRRYVALKVVKLGMDTSQVLARFSNERQALAVMDHPNIAHLFDAGATPKGRPYFVMEYIDGAPITRYCDYKRMTISRRLTLFLDVCRAVQHAHQKGVIHRDLKPSNVLVMEQEGSPLPKVIDFGIAKATDQWAVQKTLLTEFGQMVGTPEYASPEQADVMTGSIDETSDVYALGVLLYELLVGTLPFDPARLSNAGVAEMLRIIREEDAPRPSRALNATSTAAEAIAEHRQTNVVSLRRILDGDLTWITLKALEKARERRYRSVGELAGDIQRYIEHQPIIASPPSRVYRARKFVRRHKLGVFSSAAGLAFVLLSAVTFWSLVHRSSLPSPGKENPANKGAVVVSDFSNTTGDSAFGPPLRQVLVGELGRSPHLNVLSDARMHDTLRLMVKPDAKVTPEIASEICERTRSGAVVEGSIAPLGSQYLLTLRARNCRTGDALDDEEAPAASKGDVLRVLVGIAERLAAKAGQSVPPMEKQLNLSADVTTPSLEAWRSYNAGMRAVQGKGSPAEVISLLKRATEIDPKFAMAYALLGRSYDSLGEAEQGARSIARAYELRDRVTDQENYFITFNYYRQVPRNLEMARQTAESWAQKYPDDYMPHSFLSGFVSPGTGHSEKAAEEGERTIGIDPNFSIAYYNAAFAYIYVGRLADAVSLLGKASARKLETPQSSLCRYLIAFLRNDAAAMEEEVTERKSRLESQGAFEHQEALTLAYHGRVKEANQLSESAVALARQGGFRERPAEFDGARAVWNALFGMREAAQRSAATSLSRFQGRDADYGPAFAFALLRDSAQVKKIVAELEKKYPEDTSVQFSYLPALRAFEALNHGEPAKAVELSKRAEPYEFAIPGTAYLGGGAPSFGALYPVYVRGLAYFRLNQYSAAAAEFQKILDHPGMTLNDPIGPMARLQLARALSAAGDHAKSATVYRDLLGIWKDADADLPVIQQARAESAKERM